MAELLLPQSALGHITHGDIYFVGSDRNEATRIPSDSAAAMTSKLGVRAELSGLVIVGASDVNAALNGISPTEDIKKYLADVPILQEDGQPNSELVKEVGCRGGEPLVNQILWQGAVLLGAAYVGSNVLNNTQGVEHLSGNVLQTTLTRQVDGVEEDSNSVSIQLRRPEGRQSAGTVVFANPGAEKRVGIRFEEPIYKDRGSVSVQVTAIPRGRGFATLDQITRVMGHATTQTSRLRRAG